VSRSGASASAWVGTALGAIAGAALFVWSIRAAGPSVVLEDVSRLGVGFIVVLLLGGVRQFIRTLAWRCCLESPDRLPLGVAFLACVAGDSLGNVTPFGFLISEPSKIVLTRRYVTPTESVAALTVENLLYSATVVVLLLSGTAAMLSSFSVATPLRFVSVSVLAATAALAIGGLWVLRSRKPLVSSLGRLAVRHRVATRYLKPRVAQVEEVERRVFDFAGRYREKVLFVLGLEIVFHAIAVVEIWLVLSLIIGTPASILAAFVLEYVNRCITIAFQFIPMWLGVDEAGTGLVASALRLGSATGVSVALARKGRTLIWTAVGMCVLAHKGLSVRSTVREAEGVAAHDVA
jgi:hypothetical protein